jgi:hypothetical protein
MRKSLLIIFALLLSFSSFAELSKDSAQVYMQQANKLYEASEYQNALGLYHSIEAE